MLKKSNLLFSVIISAMMITACSDKESKTEKNADYITVDGNKINLTGVFWLLYDASPSTDDHGNTYYRNEVVFTDKEISLETVYDEDKEEYVSRFSGNGSILSLSIVGADEEFKTGQYTWTGTEEDPTPFDIWDANLYLNFNSENGTRDTYVATTFSMKVEPDGDFYKVILEGTVYPALIGDGGSIMGPDLSGKASVIKGQISGDYTAHEEL